MTIKVAPVKRQIPLLLLCLLCGTLCIFLAYRAVLSLGRPEVFLRLVPVAAEGRTRVALRFTNIGTRDIALPLGGMEYFVFVPADDSRRYRVHVNGGGGVVTLAPGKSIDSGDIYPLIRNLPAGGGTLEAVYVASDVPSGSQQAWTGVVHSPYMTLEVAGN